jgi:SAM-dependent methyltransferase
VTRSNFVSRDGAGYELQMGRWSQRLASLFAEFGGVGDGDRVLDMGCGTGSLTAEIVQRSSGSSVVGLDFSAAYVKYASEHVDGQSHFLMADGAMLPFSDGVFDRSFSQLVLHFVPDPILAIAELGRVTRPGGVVAATVWDAGGGVTVNRLFCDTAAAVSPGGEAFRRRIFGRPMTQSGALMRAWQQAGFVEVEETTLTIRMDFESFDDYWAPYVGGDGPYAAFVSTLDDMALTTLTDAVRQAYLGGLDDGPRSFAASAWAVRGQVAHQR